MLALTESRLNLFRRFYEHAMFRIFKRFFAGDRSSLPKPQLDPKAAKERVLIEIGKALLLCQVVEQRLNILVHYVFRDSSLSAIEILRDTRRKHTLGPLIEKLSKRVIVHPDFDALLSDFLEHRNTFIHNLIRLPEFELESESGRESSLKLVTGLLTEGNAIIAVTKVHVERFSVELEARIRGARVR